MIKLEHVSKAYSAGIPALNDVNLEIDDGEFVFVCGDSGSGKSTLIKLLLKELDPTDGTITVDGRNLTRIRHKQVPKYRRNVGVVFQDFRLLKDRNVYENVAFALKVIGASTAVIKKKVPQMLSMVGLGLGIHLAKSRACAVIITAYSIFNFIYMILLAGVPGGWLIIVCGVYSIIYTFKYQNAWNKYQQTGQI